MSHSQHQTDNNHQQSWLLGLLWSIWLFTLHLQSTVFLMHAPMEL